MSKVFCPHRCRAAGGLLSQRNPRSLFWVPCSTRAEVPPAAPPHDPVPQFSCSPSSSSSSSSLSSSSSSSSTAAAAATAPSSLPLPSRNWIPLPPVPREGGLVNILKQSDMKAVNWVKRCMPHLPQYNIEKLFALRQVRLVQQGSQAGASKDVKLKIVAREESLPAGLILYISKSAEKLIKSTKQAKVDQSSDTFVSHRKKHLNNK